MRDEEGGLARVRPDIERLALNKLAHPRVQVGKGFVEQEDFSVNDKSADDWNTLARSWQGLVTV